MTAPAVFVAILLTLRHRAGPPIGRAPREGDACVSSRAGVWI